MVGSSTHATALQNAAREGGQEPEPKEEVISSSSQLGLVMRGLPTMPPIPSWVLSSSALVRVWPGDGGPAFPPLAVRLGKEVALLWETQKTGLTFHVGQSLLHPSSRSVPWGAEENLALVVVTPP